jgi:hypothetical protein
MSARTAVRLTSCLLVTLVSACRAPRSPASPSSSGPAPRVVIAVVVDQLAAWEAMERWPRLPADGGFRRLAREGLWVRELRFEHAATDTAPGHAALFSGAPPRESGLFANETLGRDDKTQSILRDERTRLVTTTGALVDRPGSSLARLRVETLADALVAAAPAASVYSFSLKDRGALPAAGRRPTLAMWLDVPSGQFVSSTAYATPPAWTAPLGGLEAVTAARANGWTLDAEAGRFVAEQAETSDDQDGEGDLDGLGRKFPHPVPSAKALRATALGDRLLFGLARGALAEIAAPANAGAPPALLVLSLSAHDYVQHVFGPDSWEAWAELLELDRQLGALLAEADRAVGPDRWALLLSSDHGGGALPEVGFRLAGGRCAADGGTAAPDPWERSCEPRRRLAPGDLITAVERGISAELGPGPWVRGFADPFVYLSPRGHALAGSDRARLVRAAGEALRRLGVRDVVDARARAESCGEGATMDALVCRAIDPDAGADLFLLVAPGAFFEADLVPGFGMNHGSPYLYDRAVPLVVRAPGRVPAGATRDTPVTAAAFAHTAASLLGVRAPEAARGGEDLTAPK